jgi:uncharacterized membrane protein YdjX (TVP38/TMEM64 family)
MPEQLRRLLRPKVLIAIVVIAAIALGVKRLGSEAMLKDTLAWIARLGAPAPIAFISAYIILAVLFIPGAILTISGGLLFGLAYGTIYVSVGATLGATCAFLIGRYVARDGSQRSLPAMQISKRSTRLLRARAGRSLDSRVSRRYFLLTF